MMTLPLQFISMLQMRRNAASAMAAGAKGPFVRTSDVSAERSELPLPAQTCCLLSLCTSIPLFPVLPTQVIPPACKHFLLKARGEMTVMPLNHAD